MAEDLFQLFGRMRGAIVPYATRPRVNQTRKGEYDFQQKQSDDQRFGIVFSSRKVVAVNYNFLFYFILFFFFLH